MLENSSIGTTSVLTEISSSEKLFPPSDTESFTNLISSSKGGQGRWHVAVERYHLCAQMIYLTKALPQFCITLGHREVPAPCSSAEERTERVSCSY